MVFFSNFWAGWDFSGVRCVEDIREMLDIGRIYGKKLGRQLVLPQKEE
jgi:hypothetical protein